MFFKNIVCYFVYKVVECEIAEPHVLWEMFYFCYVIPSEKSKNLRYNMYTKKKRENNKIKLLIYICVCPETQLNLLTNKKLVHKPTDNHLGDMSHLGDIGKLIYIPQ